MSRKAAVTVLLPREEVERRWNELHPEGAADVTFKDAPGDRGTEIHLEARQKLPGGKVGAIVEGLVDSSPLAKAKDELRRFKHLVETGEIPRSEGNPEGAITDHDGASDPAQPREGSELQKAGL